MKLGGIDRRIQNVQKEILYPVNQTGRMEDEIYNMKASWKQNCVIMVFNIYISVCVLYYI